MAVKSALMTTGYDVLDGPNDDPDVIFSQGAGHVQPNEAVDPGLVFDSGWNDWLAFICATQPSGLEATCGQLADLGYPTDASDFNSPSIAIGDLPGEQTVTRTVTNVTKSAGRYNITWTGLDGFDVTVEPASFTVLSGASQEIRFTFKRTDAPLQEYTGGQITIESRGANGHTVRVPAVIRPVALAAPAEVSSDGSGISYDVAFGYTGDFSASARGLVAANLNPGTVDQDPDQTFDPSDEVGTVMFLLDVPTGTTYQRFALFDSDVTSGTDLDLFVFGPTGAFVGQSAAGGSDEEVNVLNPAAGTYYVFVHGWGVVGGTSPFVLHDWSIPATDAGNMTVTAPTAAVLGDTGTINLSFSGLTPGEKYLGSVAYGGTIGMPNPTIVSVNP